MKLREKRKRNEISKYIVNWNYFSNKKESNMKRISSENYFNIKRESFSSRLIFIQPRMTILYVSSITFIE